VVETQNEELPNIAHYQQMYKKTVLHTGGQGIEFNIKKKETIQVNAQINALMPPEYREEKKNNFLPNTSSISKPGA
jgi:hypothetical protein